VHFFKDWYLNEKHLLKQIKSKKQYPASSQQNGTLVHERIDGSSSSLS
jgi:hypothetical protein